MIQSTILLIPEKTDPELQDVFDTWVKQGGEIRRLGKYWVREESLEGKRLSIYGNQAFAFVLAQIYGLELLSPDDKIIASLDDAWIKRSIRVRKIREMQAKDFPIFIKPVIPKMFLAAVFRNSEEFIQATAGLEAGEEILVSEIISGIEGEARSFIRNGIVDDLAIYEGEADVNTAKEFVSQFIQRNRHLLPDVVVVDLAYSNEIGWFILEFNACWGAGLNGCSAEKVVDCIAAATINPVT